MDRVTAYLNVCSYNTKIYRLTIQEGQQLQEENKKQHLSHKSSPRMFGYP